MFGNMYPIFEHKTLVSELVRDPEFADYLRWEFRPADRMSVILAVRRGALDRRRIRPAAPLSIGRRLVAWVKAMRESRRGERGPSLLAARDILRPKEALESGLLHRAFPHEKV